MQVVITACDRGCPMKGGFDGISHAWWLGSCGYNIRGLEAAFMLSNFCSTNPSQISNIIIPRSVFGEDWQWLGEDLWAAVYAQQINHKYGLELLQEKQLLFHEDVSGKDSWNQSCSFIAVQQIACGEIFNTYFLSRRGELINGIFMLRNFCWTNRT